MRAIDARAIVDHIVATVDSDGSFRKDDLLKWRQTPLVQELCEQVDVEDKSALLSMLDSDDWMIANLGVSLLRAFGGDSEIKEKYLEVWNDENRELYTRFCVMYPLLDDPELPQEQHSAFYDVVKRNMDEYIPFVLTYYTSPEEVIPTVTARLTDQKYPESKHWIYFCTALATPDRNDAQAFIEEHAPGRGPFVDRVAADLLQMLGAEE